MKDAVLSTKQAAELLGTTRQNIQLYIKVGRWPKGGAFQMRQRGQWKVYSWAVEKMKQYA